MEIDTLNSHPPHPKRRKIFFFIALLGLFALIIATASSSRKEPSRAPVLTEAPRSVVYVETPVAPVAPVAPVHATPLPVEAKAEEPAPNRLP